MNTLDEMNREHARRRFEAYAYHFFKRWAPEGEEDKHRFSAELFTLVREIYREAGEPYAKALSDAYQLVATPLIIKDLRP